MLCLSFKYSSISLDSDLQRVCGVCQGNNRSWCQENQAYTDTQAWTEERNFPLLHPNPRSESESQLELTKKRTHLKIRGWLQNLN